MKPVVRTTQPSSGEIKAMYEQAKTVSKGSGEAAVKELTPFHGKRFWHGSPVSFNSGDLIESNRSVHGVAFATDDFERASAYGVPHEVIPMNPDDVKQVFEGSWEFTSPSGWKVI
jgi:hypothetical protein